MGVFLFFFSLERTGVDNVHGSHSATGVVEDPLLIQVHKWLGRGVLEVGHDISDDGAGVIAMLRNSTLREAVQLRRVENVETFKVCLQEDVDAAQKRCQRYVYGNGVHLEVLQFLNSFFQIDKRVK